MESLPLWSAMTSGAGLRRISSLAPPNTEPTEPMLTMLDVDSDLEWPRTGPPMLPAVEALARPVVVGGRILSVRICRWYLEPVAARESMGMSSLMWTV